MNQFKEKTAIITGGAEGIGLSIAQALGKQGMNLVLADIDEPNVAKAARELEDSGVPTLGIALDVGNESQWLEVAESATKRFGKVHMLVNNAGVGGGTGPLESQKNNDWDWAVNVNLMGVVYGAKTVVPLIKQHNEPGWIVNVASMAGMGGVPFGGAYTATKTAVVGLSESWAGELQNTHISVAVLCPAFVQTRIHESQRNRQPRFASDSRPSGAADVLTQRAAEAVKNGIDVSIVGERVVEALNQGEFYIFTHPNYRPVTQKRAQLIEEAFERAAASPLLQEILDRKIEML